MKKILMNIFMDADSTSFKFDSSSDITMPKEWQRVANYLLNFGRKEKLSQIGSTDQEILVKNINIKTISKITYQIYSINQMSANSKDGNSCLQLVNSRFNK